MGENFGDEVDQSLNLYGNHGWMFGLSLVAGLTKISRSAFRPDVRFFAIGLAGTLSEKSR